MVKRLDESPYKEFQKDDYKKLLEDHNEPVIHTMYPDALRRGVSIWDETLRDGEQTAGVSLKTEEKVDLANRLDEIGVKIIAAGFPVVSKQELATVKEIAARSYTNAKIAAVSRMVQEDIDAVIATDCQEIIFFIPLSDLQLDLVLRKTKEQVLDMTVNALDYAHEHGLTASIVAEDASRASTDFVIEYFRLGLNNGAKRLVYADTVGVLFPETTHVIIRDIIQQLKASHGDDVELSIHVHDDFGLATANTIAAVLEGVTYPQTCINGYGERAGNCALEEISVALEMNGIKTGIALEQLMSISKAAEEYFGIPITSHKPIVGGLAFSHESGIHVNALLMHPLTYEPIPPKKVGATRHFYLGKFSGMKSIADRLSSIGMEFPNPILHEIVEEVKQKQERKDKEDRKQIFHNILNEMEEIRMGVTDEEFWEIVRTVIKKHEEYQNQVKNIPSAKKQKSKH